MVDSLNYDFLPFKPALVPTFIGTQGIIDYAIENYENIIVELVNFNDSIKIKIIFPDKVIENYNYNSEGVNKAQRELAWQFEKINLINLYNSF